MTALDWGWNIEETAARLMEVSSKARENGERYAARTAQNAAAAVERNGQRKGRG
jgi:homoserine acetyltransferase